MLTAMTAVDNILEGRTDKANIWAVNTEMEYHEMRSSEEPAQAERQPTIQDAIAAARDSGGAVPSEASCALESPNPGSPADL